MNKRIEELAEQVGLWNDMDPTSRPGRFVGHMNVSDVEKFAQLIVRECANRIDYWESRQGEHSDDLLKHFGVI